MARKRFLRRSSGFILVSVPWVLAEPPAAKYQERDQLQRKEIQRERRDTWQKNAPQKNHVFYAKYPHN